VQELRKKLIEAGHKRRLDVRVLNEAKRAREQVSKQMTMLREQGRKLASELKTALSESDRRHKAREAALAKIAELKADLTRKTDELKRKSHELAQLARESAAKAHAIIEEKAPPSASPAVSTTDTSPAPHDVTPSTSAQAEPKPAVETPSEEQGA
jgi:predicted nuclease with TOPRIM domain